MLLLISFLLILWLKYFLKLISSEWHYITKMKFKKFCLAKLVILPIQKKIVKTLQKKDIQ